MPVSIIASAAQRFGTAYGLVVRDRADCRGDQLHGRVAGRRINLQPGMAVTVEIRTDTRRVIEYLLSSLQRTRHDALHER